VTSGGYVRVNPPRGERVPLVYATATALEQARQVIPGRVLENEVGRLITAKRARFIPAEDLAYVKGAGWVAKCVRVQSPLTRGRRCWRVVEVRAL
jgi:hypothetical protein